MAETPNALTRLDELMAAIRGYEDPRRASAEWKQVYKLLQGAGLPPGRVTAVVGMRDVPGLAGLIDQLRAPQTEAPADSPSKETCRKALQAFRKRLSLTVLDEDSALGRGPLSKGGGARAAITPPREWPEGVWRELVRQGKLRDIGHGFYELVDR
jgi:hypothetical protein